MAKLTEDYVFEKKNYPMGLFAPVPGLYTYMHMTIFSTLKPLSKLKLNFTWSFLEKREHKFVKIIVSHDKDGHSANIW